MHANLVEVGAYPAGFDAYPSEVDGYSGEMDGYSGEVDGYSGEVDALLVWGSAISLEMGALLVLGSANPARGSSMRPSLRARVALGTALVALAC